LIGGGSKGIHKITQVIGDFMDVTRQRINEPPKPPEEK